MNRRNFFKSLSLFAAGLAVSPLKISKQVRGPVPPYVLEGKYVLLNPEWMKAPYEISFFVGQGTTVYIPYPFRFRFRNLADAQFFMEECGRRTKTTWNNRPAVCCYQGPRERIKLCDTPPVC